MDESVEAFLDNESVTTVTTESSTGTLNSDVGIFCHSKQLKKRVEKLLQERKYTIDNCIIAGRDKIKNLQSTIHHANQKVILLTKGEESKLQIKLAPFIRPGCFTVHNTLLIIGKEIETRDIHDYFKKFPQMQMAQDTDVIAQHIAYFIETGIQSEHQQAADPGEKMRLFGSLLLSAIINPFGQETPLQITFRLLSKRFKKQFGGFRALQVGNMKEFIKRSPYYELQNLAEEMVVQTNAGCQIAAMWMYRVNHSASLRECQIPSNDAEESATNFSPSPLCLQNENNVEETTINSETSTTFCPSVEKHERVQILNDSSVTLPLPERSLAEHIDGLDSSYAYLLIASKVDASVGLESICNIPWLHVFDFDSRSREDGLLSRTETKIQDQRNLTISVLPEAPNMTSEKATHWVFAKGLQEKPHTVFNGTSSAWRKSSKLYLKQHCRALADFCCFHKQAVIFVLWYDDDEDNTRCLEWLLIKLDEAFSDEAEEFLVKVIICTSTQLETDAVLQQIVDSFTWEISTINISVESVSCVLAHKHIGESARQDLPNVPMLCEDNTIKRVSIAKKSFAWLNDSLEVLAFPTGKEQEETGNADEEFVKGGTLAWDETSVKKIAVERSIQQDVYQYIKKKIIDACMSAIIRIYHAPGGGGTTFGRQLLWKLRNDAPCGVVTPAAALSISGLIERIQFLHNLTLLPVVVLVDGRSDYDVQNLYESTYAVVILHIQRYNNEIKESKYHRGSCWYLAGNVTESESEELAEMFSKFAPKSKTALDELYQDVVDKNARQVFEFGLAAFNHEFKGVRKYVKGYMEPRSADLQDWQKVVAYLSLLMYYGQCGLPGSLFRSLTKTSYHPLTTPESLHSGRQFITNDRGYWKINYNAVAKEILEFVLSLNSENAASTERLSTQARDKLHLLVIDFVKYVGEAVGSNASDNISYPLSQMVLKRDSYSDIEEADVFNKKKKFSRLLDDIQSEENRVEVLKQFTRVFPKHAELRAHLGRLYSMHNKFKESEKCFECALELRTKERSDPDLDKTDNVRGRFHHMFGFSYLHRIRYDCEHGDTVQALKTAKKAVYQFSQGRKYAVHNRSYGYIGEVRARLLLVGLFRKHHNIAEAFTGKLKKHQDLAEFVQESHSVCDQLLVECEQYTAPTDLKRISDYFTCVSNFNDYFQGIPCSLRDISSLCPNIQVTRSKIASIKMKSKPRNKKDVKHIDDITNQRDIVEIVELLDATLREVFSNDLQYVPISISVEMLQWLEAIRHPLMPDKYTLIDVLHFVQQWERRNEFGLATFYLYVINFLMAIWASGIRQRQSYVDKATELGQKLRTSLQQNRIHQRSRESLANHNDFTIRKLLPRRSVGVWDKYKQEWSNIEAAKKLQVCTGTVIKSALPLIGFISLDVSDPIPNRKIEVYFVPKRHGLHGRRFSDQCTRVQFYLVFNTHNGAEAEAVTIIERKECSTCRMLTEAITLNQPSEGQCNHCGRCYE